MTTVTDAVVSADGAPCVRFLDLLRCPLSGSRLVAEGDALVSADGMHRYPVNAAGVPLFKIAARSALVKTWPVLVTP